MATIDLTQYGITGTTEIVHNPDYNQLFREELRPDLEGYERGQVTEMGDAVNVMTGIYTGRSPKDKYIVDDETSHDTVWWTSDEYKNDNKRATQKAWNAVREIAIRELCNKRLFVVDAFCGANVNTRMSVRFITEVPWQAHFVTNMFIRPTAEELENFKPDFVVFNAAKARVMHFGDLGLNSETAVMFNLTSREQVIINTWYGGEMKKGIFSMMNYYLPLKGIASMHCSANTDKEGQNTTLFFGLSGTGKTTLARLLTGLNAAQEGRFAIAGQPVPASKLLSRVGIVLQNADHQLHMKTVRQELEVSLSLAGCGADDVPGLLSLFALEGLAERHPQSLSGGEKQRLVIACAFAKRPDVLILDEPTSGLDGRNMRRIADALELLAGRGACVLVITHDLELMGLSCARALRLPLS